MNNNYLSEYIDLFERLLSTAYLKNYSSRMVERVISYSSFFQRIEKEHDGYASIIDDTSLVRTLYEDSSIDLMEVPSFNQCAWAAESYIRIQEETHLTFEAIFLYIPIDKMYTYFVLYHEMDFSQIVDEFKSRLEANSVLDVLLSQHDISLKDIAEELGISYETLYSYKQRRRDIKKMPADLAYSLANILKVRLETLLELKL